ncbi:MAG: glycerophosphodiester phosphodiesterase [Bacteroidales bacterium]
MATRHPFLDAARPLVFAHRGGSALAPENTLAAFDNGLALGADGLELDVHLSHDGRVVVHHDPSLDRTTNGAGPLSAMTAAALGQLDAGCRFPGAGDFPYKGRGFSVPTLRTVLERYRGVRIIIEMKGRREDLARETLAEVRRAQALDTVCFAGAEVRLLQVVRSLEPQAATSAGRAEIRWALYRSWAGWSPGRRSSAVRRLAGVGSGYLVFQVPEKAGSIRVVSPRFVRAAHSVGVPVQVWTVDQESDMRRLLGWSIDGIITDRPDIAVSVVRSLY